MKINHALIAASLLAVSATAGAQVSPTSGPGYLTVNNPVRRRRIDPVAVTGFNGEGGQFAGDFWAVGAKPADSFFRFFCAETRPKCQRRSGDLRLLEIHRQ